MTRGELEKYAHQHELRLVYGGRGGEWVEWAPPISSKGQKVAAALEVLFAEVFESAGYWAHEDPLCAGEIEPFLLPRYVHHVLKSPVPTDRDAHNEIVLRIMRGGDGHTQLAEHIQVRDDLEKQVQVVRERIALVTGGVEKLLKTWIADELRSSVVGLVDRKERAMKWNALAEVVRDVWTRFSNEWGHDTEYREYDPREALRRKPWRACSPAVAVSLTRGLGHYHGQLKRLWEVGAKLDVQRYAYDVAIHALRIGDEPPLRIPASDDEEPKKNDRRSRSKRGIYMPYKGWIVAWYEENRPDFASDLKCRMELAKKFDSKFGDKLRELHGEELMISETTIRRYLGEK